MPSKQLSAIIRLWQVVHYAECTSQMWQQFDLDLSNLCSSLRTKPDMKSPDSPPSVTCRLSEIWSIRLTEPFLNMRTKSLERHDFVAMVHVNSWCCDSNPGVSQGVTDLPACWSSQVTSALSIISVPWQLPLPTLLTDLEAVELSTVPSWCTCISFCHCEYIQQI